MPLGNASNWSELMRNVEEASLRTKNTTRASYNFRNIYFMDEFLGEHMKQRGGGDLDASDLELDDIPDHMHMLRHVYRSANYTKPGQVCYKRGCLPQFWIFLRVTPHKLSAYYAPCGGHPKCVQVRAGGKSWLHECARKKRP